MLLRPKPDTVRRMGGKGREIFDNCASTSVRCSPKLTPNTRKRQLGVEAQIAPGIPVIAKDVTEAIVSGGVSGVAPGG
jgi:hypothetical protein